MGGRIERDCDVDSERKRYIEKDGEREREREAKYIEKKEERGQRNTKKKCVCVRERA